MARARKFTPRRALLLAALVVAIVAIMAVLFAREDLYTMFSTLRSANYGFVLLALGLYFFSVALWAARWHVTLSTVGHQVGTRDLYLIILGGIFINNITPFTYSGGDPVARAYLINKTHEVPYSSGFATIVGESVIIDPPIFLLFLMFGLVMSFQEVIWSVPITVGIGVIAIAFWILLFWRIFYRRAGAGRIGGFMARLAGLFRKRVDKARIRKGIKRFYMGAEKIISTRKIVFYVIAFSVILWTLGVTRLFLIFQALGYNPPIQMLLLGMTLPAVVGLVPVLPGGLGTVDATMVSVFLAFGVPLEIAMSAMLIERAISFVFSTAVGACALSYLGVRVWVR